MKGTVFLVHCVDTEGPLYESLETTFQRLKENFQLNFEPSLDILQKLRRKEIPLDGKEDAVLDFVRPEQINYNNSWEKIHQMHKVLMSPKVRSKFLDSWGEGYRFNWFCMDHVGYLENPRQRTMGFHAVFSEYQQILKKYNATEDRIYWHYHPMSFTRQAHRSGTNYSFSNLHNEILARRIIDHKWFPVANRATSAEHMDSSLWLEQWMPFDFANHNMENNIGLEKHEAAGRVPGRFGDWRSASTDWRIYNPSVWDSRKPGSLKRYIARCLNLNCRHSNIDEYELRKAFLAANTTEEDILVSVTNHDFRDMVTETIWFIELVQKVSNDFPNVKIKWANAVEAMRAVLKMQKTNPPSLSLKIENNLLHITSDKQIWGPQPFLAIRTKEGNYYHDNFIIDSDTDWTYAFDYDSILLDAIDSIGVATNDLVGNTVIAVCNLSELNKWQINYLNTEDWLESN